MKLTDEQRAKLIARLTWLAPTLTDAGLMSAVVLVEQQPRRKLDGEALAAAQAEREARP